MNKDDSVPYIYDRVNTVNPESWIDFFKDDGDLLLAKSETYINFQNFENAYYIQHKSTPLHHAIQSNKALIVRKILLKGSDINSTDYLSHTPLYYSILMDNVEIVQLLLNYGAPINGSFIENEFEITYFERVCQSSNWQIVKLFLNHGCNANEIFINNHWSCPKNSTPLHMAVIYRRLETVKILLSYHANVNYVNEEGESPLYLACKENYAEIVEILLTQNALVNIYTKANKTPLYEGIKNGNYKIIELLLTNGAFIENEIKDIDINIYDQIHVAISLGYFKILEDLLSHGLNINDKYHSSEDEYNRTFLHTAVEYEQIEIVGLLLTYNAKLNVKDRLGRVPLHIAALIESEVMIELLLQYDPDLIASPENSTINAMDNQGSTALHIACKGIISTCVQLLINFGADINAENFKGKTPLYFACDAGNFDIVDFLIKKNVDVNTCTEENSTPLHIAAKNGHEQIVTLLLVNKANTIIKDKNGFIPLKLAVDSGNIKIVEMLLQYNPDVNNDYYQNVFLDVLDLPRISGCKIVNFFFKYGFNINSDLSWNYKQTMLFNAARNNYWKIVKQLLNEDVYLDKFINGETLLHLASKNSRWDIVQLLIEKNVNINIRNMNGNKIPLYYAVENCDETTVNIFLSHGADVKVHPELLLCAIIKCSHNCKGTLRMLLDYGANVNYCSNIDYNALHLIMYILANNCSKEQFYNYFLADSLIETVEFLLEKGIDVNAKTKLGWTALHMTIVLNKNFVKLIEILLRYDADIDCQNVNGMTPLHLACKMKNLSAVTILLNFGANVNVEDTSGSTPLEIVYKYMNSFEPIKIVFDTFSAYVRNNMYFFNKLKDMFIKHLIKMITAKLYVSPKNIQFMDININFRNDCEKEINIIRELKINNYVSVLDILTKNLTTVARYTKNNIPNIYKLLDNQDKYPLFNTLIAQKLLKAVKREYYLDKAQETIRILSGCGLPDACTENIIIYLKNYDLHNLCSLSVNSFTRGFDKSMDYN